MLYYIYTYPCIYIYCILHIYTPQSRTTVPCSYDYGPYECSPKHRIDELTLRLSITGFRRPQEPLVATLEGTL